MPDQKACYFKLNKKNPRKFIRQYIFPQLLLAKSDVDSASPFTCMLKLEVLTNSAT